MKNTYSLTCRDCGRDLGTGSTSAELGQCYECRQARAAKLVKQAAKYTDPDKRDADGTLPAYAWPGAYTIIYVAQSYGELIQLCANCATKTADSADADEYVYSHELYEEGPDEICEHCGATIESSYGDPDQADDDDDDTDAAWDAMGFDSVHFSSDQEGK